MTMTGKALTQTMCNAAPKYSCFIGCSTGGRQRLMEAQRYPKDYNGIVSAAPAINWPRQSDANAMTPELFEHFWDQSIEQYGIVIGIDNPDLGAFRDHGGKLVLWRGWADQLIAAQGPSTTTGGCWRRWVARNWCAFVRSGSVFRK
jgi:hypothetical protein